MKRKLKYGGIGLVVLFVLFLLIPVPPDKPTVQQIAPQPPQTTSPVVIEEAIKETPPVTPTSSNQIIAPTPSNLYAVTQVVDGDTIKVSIDGSVKTVRLIGIDTPETVDPRKPVQCFGEEASNKAKAILSGKKVRLEVDSTQGDLDKYQRLLRYVFLEDATFFNKLMITEGYAHEYTYDTAYTYQADFRAAEKLARESKVGLWNPETCNGNTVSSESSSSTTQTQPTQANGHTFYVSSHYSAKYYYCDTDNGWKGLSPTYLKSYPSEQALLADYPTKTLHEACK
jgi:micrococcal nuclease